MMSKPVKVLEDSAQRFWYEYVPTNNQTGKTRAWYVGIPVKGNVCGAQITMKDGPSAKGNAAIEKAAAPYAGPKGNLRFPLDRRIPYALIARIVKFRAAASR